MDNDIFETIIKLNPWYKQSEVPNHLVEKFKRREFKNLYKSLKENDFVTLLAGGRRVGKSVLFYQLINQLCLDGVDPKRILFIQGDSPALQEQHP